MNDSKLKNEGGDSFESVYEGFLDPHEEVFIGPITEREKELRKNLPRRTLHLTYLSLIWLYKYSFQI